MNRAPNIDLTLPNIGRVCFSAESRDKNVVQARRLMVKELALRPGAAAILRARVHGLITTTELHQAYLQGSDALADLLKQKKERPLADLAREYLGTKSRPDRIRAHLDCFLWQEKQLTAEAVERFLVGLKCSGATRNRYRASLSGFGSWLVARGHIPVSPFRDSKIAKWPERAARMPELSDGEWQQYVWHVGWAHNLIARVLIHTGADLGEVIALKKEQCSLVVEVPRILFRRTKIIGARDRAVPIPRKLAEDLLPLREFCGTPDGRMWNFTDKEFRAAHEKARAAIGRPDLRIKDFRHLAAIAWRRAGVGIETIRDRLGHSSIAMTMRYAAFRPSDEFDQRGTEEAARLITG